MKKFAKSVDHEAALIEEIRTTPGYAQLYLQTALEEIYEEGGVGAFLTALRHVVDASGGIGVISAKSGLSREQLYKTLSENGNPTLKSLTEITRAAGVKFFSPIA
ncbi:DNA-binding protein [Erwinia sp.]|uniref:helix-turn-helix domain-containing transcriptional regulator n=1 Tax=Erwinia citreus TaxID=558 RepID=UPI003C753B1D